MSSPEYAELRGVMGNAVTAKASILTSARKRSLLFWLQAASLERGGLRAVAEQLVEKFPERLGTRRMIEQGIRAGQKLTDEQVLTIRKELNPRESRLDDPKFDESEYGQEIARDEKRTWLARLPHDSDHYLDRCRRLEPFIAYLIDLCINPRQLLAEPCGDSKANRDSEVAAFIAEHEGLTKSEFLPSTVPWFHDICGALYELQERSQKAAAASIANTTVARRVHQTLDACLKSRRMVLIEGQSDSGKSTSAEAWCRMHQGEARFVRLQGVTNKTVFFRAIARALGVASSYMRTAKEMQARVEDVLQRSGLCLVLDESQYAFAQSERIYSRPELVDWIYTACCNHGVPVALVATPLFSKRLHQAERQTIWNSAQFKRRIYRYEMLPPKPTRADIELVVKHHLPDADYPTHKFLAGYAATALHPFTAVADTLADAALLAEEAGRPRIALKDLMEAVKTFRTTSELAKSQAFDAPSARKRAGRPPSAPSVQEPCSGAAATLHEQEQEEESEDTFTGRSRPVAALKTTPKRDTAPVLSEA